MGGSRLPRSNQGGEGGGGDAPINSRTVQRRGAVVAKRQMQNNLHEKPDHDPSSSSSSPTVFPSPAQLLEHIKAHLCHIKAERQGGGGVSKKLHTRFLFLKAKNKHVLFICCCFLREGVWLVDKEGLELLRFMQAGGWAELGPGKKKVGVGRGILSDE